MKETGSFANWLSIAANLGIVAGLVMVALQLMQDREIADTNIESENFSNAIAYFELQVGEDSADSLSRAIFAPNELTDRDKVVLDALYSAEVTKAIRIERLLEPGHTVKPITVYRWTGLLINFDPERTR